MGKCCSKPKPSKTSKKSRNPPEPCHSPTPPPAKPSPGILNFKSSSCAFSCSQPYNPSKTLSSYLNPLILSHPELSSHNFTVQHKSSTLKSLSTPIQSLKINPKDSIQIELLKDKSIESSASICQEEIAEEESTTKLQVHSIHSKLSKVRTESTGDAVSLWLTALPLPNQVKFNDEDSEASSVLPLDLTIGDKVPPKFQISEVKGGQSVIIESDDSCVKGEVRGIHPNDFFRDLQGPFSVLKGF